MRKTATIAAILLLTAGTLWAQPGRGLGPCMAATGRPGVWAPVDLTEQQQEQIKQIRLKHQKEINDLSNELAEKMAAYRTLMQQDKADMKNIESNIDQRTALMAGMMKKRAAMHQEIRSVLTEEQRLLWDSGRKIDRPGRSGRMHYQYQMPGRKPRWKQ